MSPRPWQLEVFRVSVRKQEKWAWVRSALARYGLPRGHCLDLGCGVGTLGMFLEALGGSWAFLEPDAAAASEARTVLRGPVAISTLEAAAYQGSSFDLVSAFDVLEHLQEPAGFLDEVARVLVPGGFFVATTPAAEAQPYLWRAAGKKFFGITKEAHGHIVEGFSATNLRRLVRDAGLEPYTVEAFSRFFTEAVELLYNGVYHRQNVRCQSATGYNLALSPASGADVRRHAWALPWLRVIAPLFRGIARLDHVLPSGRGYEYGVVARKPMS